MSRSEMVDAIIAERIVEARNGKTNGKAWIAAAAKRFSDWAKTGLTVPVSTLDETSRERLVSLLRDRAEDAADKSIRAAASRPSYAPKGKLTASEQGAQALLLDAVEMYYGAVVTLK